MFQSKEFWMGIRQALLMITDAIERELGISPTTAEIRDEYKRGITHGIGKDL